jgi:Cu+-exporting ATPase
MIKLSLVIKDMHCSNCAIRIEGIEDELPGIRQISASYRQGTVKLEFDPQQVSESEIRSAIEQLGYHLE